MDYTLSIRLMTFNHSDFVKDAMNGIMLQKTNFLVEVVVGDDFSTDDTLNLIRSYSSTEKIKINILERNKGDEYSIQREKDGRLYNFQNILKNCSGKYIALLDGDDYWTDENKLQKQVDFLEANPDFSICFHNMNVIYDDGRESHFSNLPNQKEISTIEDLAKTNFIFTASCVFRNRDIVFPDWFLSAPVGDYILHMLNAQYGKLKYFNDVMAVYRIHKGGMWSNKNEEQNAYKWIRMQNDLIGMFSKEVNDIIINQQIENLLYYHHLIGKSGNKNEFENFYLKCYSLMPSYIEKKIATVIDSYESICEKYKNEIHRLNMSNLSILNSTEFKIGKRLLSPIKRIFRK